MTNTIGDGARLGCGCVLLIVMMLLAAVVAAALLFGGVLALAPVDQK